MSGFVVTKSKGAKPTRRTQIRARVRRRGDGGLGGGRPAHQGHAESPAIQDTFALSHDSLAAFALCYRTGPILVFTGAGVSYTAADYYRTPGWRDLLLELFMRLSPEREPGEQRRRFEQLRKSKDPWEVASVLCRQAGGEMKLAQLIHDVLGRRAGRDLRYQRLPTAYLNNAVTLNAVVAFCLKVRGFRRNACFEPNPRVRAVLTLNYDWFTEGGATQKCNKYVFKPMASAESSLGEGQLPVHHVHGYVPFRIDDLPRYELTLTAESYRRAYEPGGRACKLLTEHLGAAPALFVGLSFEDRLLRELLALLARKRGTPRHFALMHAGETDHALRDELRDIGVDPILYTNHAQIPELLGYVYGGALRPNDLRVPRESAEGGVYKLTPASYWKTLLSNKR